MGNNGKRSVLLNSVFLFLGSIFAKSSSFAFNILVSQQFGSSGLGIFGLGIMILSICGTVALLGLPDGLINFVGRYDSNRQGGKVVGIISSSFIISGFVSLFFLIIIHTYSGFISTEVLNEPKLDMFLPIFSIGIPAFVFIRLTGAVSHGVSKSQYKVLIQQVIPKGLLLIGTVGVIFVEWGILALGYVYIGSLVIGAVVGALITVLIVLRRLDNPIEYETNRMLRFSLPLLFSGFVGMLLTWTDTFFVGFFLQTSDVGLYRAAYLIGANIPIFISSIAGGLYPSVAGHVEQGQRDQIIKKYRVSQKWIAILTLAPTMYLIVFASSVLRTLFGADFGASSTVLIAVVIGNTIGALVGPATVMLKTLGRSQYILTTNILALSINVAVNILLIPRIGILAAGLSTMSATILTNVLHYSVIKSRFDVTINLKPIGLLGATGFLVGFGLKYSIPLPRSFIYLPFHIGVFSVLYLVLAYLTGIISRTELKQVRSLLSYR